MKSSSKVFTAAATAVLLAGAAWAAHVDMKDPRRALGNDSDIRIDAELMQDSVGSNSGMGVTYQIENHTSAPIAIADKLCTASYDPDTHTIVFSIGSEIPTTKTVPHLAVVKPGEKRVLTAGAVVHVAVTNINSPFAPRPRFVQIEVNVLRDIQPFAEAIALQAQNNIPSIPLGDDMFDQWVQSNDSIYLNSLPIRWKEDARESGIAGADASSPGPDGMY